ncbi:helix-turn-helix transcriptional regulator [Frondihabitans sucicola]
MRSALERLRHERGFSFERLRDESGVSRTAIIKLEQGRSTGSLRTWCKISNALGVPFWQLAKYLDEPIG